MDITTTIARQADDLRKVDTRGNLLDRSAPAERSSARSRERRTFGRFKPSSVVIFVVVSVVRATYSWGRSAPQIVPDEYAILGMGRWMTGGNWNMFGAATWRPGLSILMIPFHLVLDSPTDIYRSGVLLNALFGGLSAVLLVSIGERVTTLRRWPLWLGAVAVSSTPAALEASALVWAEALVTVSFLATVLLLIDFVSERSADKGYLAILTSAAGFLAHSRLLPLCVGTTVCVAVLLWRDRRRQASVLSAVLGFALVGAISLFCRWVIGNLYEATSETNTVAGTAGRLLKPHLVVDAILGQSWYLLAVSGTMVGLGIVGLVAQTHTGRSQERVAAAVTLVATALMFAVSALFMSGRDRGDYAIYGRYNEAIIGPVLLVAIAWLLTAPSRAHVRRSDMKIMILLFALTATLGLFVEQYHGLQLDTGGVAKMIPGLVPALSAQGSIEPIAISVVAIAFGALMFGLAMTDRRRALTTAGVIVLVTVGATAWSANRSGGTGPDSAADVVEISNFVPEFEPVGYAFVDEEFAVGETNITQLARALAYQWYLPELQLVRDAGPGDGVGPFVFAMNADLILNIAGAERVWRDADREISLWREADGVTSEDITTVLIRCEGKWAQPSVDELPSCDGVPVTDLLSPAR